MKFQLLSFLILLSFSSFSQNLFPEPGAVFNDAIIPRIDISIHEDSLEVLLDEENSQSNQEYRATFNWDDGTEIKSFSNIGFRLRGNSSRSSGKKSFKIDFTKFDGPSFYGLKEMNLNGEHNDPSIIRSKLCWDLFKMAGVPSTRSNHVVLYINDIYRGLYINVEHIDKGFLKKRWNTDKGNLYKCFWGADLDYRGSNPNDYKHEPFGTRVYDLKTNKQEDDYSDLALLIDILNNENDPNFRCLLEEIFNVDSYLRALAMDILTGNWDGPIFNKNNFYLYSNPANGKFEFIPYDLDNTIGIDWFQIEWSKRNIYSWSYQGEPRPLYQSLLSIPDYRDRLSFYINQFTIDFFNNDFLDPYLDDFKNRLSSHVVNDTFAAIDYGFTHQDFLDSYENGLGDHVPYGLKEYINVRNTYASNQLQLNPIAPALSRATLGWDQNEMSFQLFVVDEITPIVKAHFNFENQGWENILLLDNGVAPDQIAGDGFYTANTPLPGIGEMSYYFTATDGGNNSKLPYCTDYESVVGYGPVDFLFINEFMADNNYTHSDENGEYDDWLEIYNGGSSSVYLGDKFLSDDHANPDKWPMPDETLDPGEFMLFWCDEDQVQGPNHTNFKLSKSGEQLGIWDSEANNYAPIDTFTYGVVANETPWGRYPDGMGPIMELSWRTPGYSNVPLAIKNPEDKITVSVFPIPTQDVLHIESSEKISRIAIISNDGKKNQIVFQQAYNPIINFSNHPAGIYFLQLIYKDQIVNKKVLKQ